MNYEVLKKRIAKGKQRVITNLVEHLWPHPSAELSVGWRNIRMVVRKLVKSDRRKAARVAVCMLEEYVPRVIPLLSDNFAAHVTFSIDLLMSCASGSLDPWVAFERYEGHAESLQWGDIPVDDLHELGEDLHDALHCAFDAIVPGQSTSILHDFFLSLMWVMLELEPSDWFGPSEEIPTAFEEMHLAKCIGRIESRFAFCDALTAVLE